MTFIRPIPSFDRFDVSLPSVYPRPGSNNPDSRVLFEYTKKNPEIIHTAVKALVSVVGYALPPVARLWVHAVYEVAHQGGHMLWDVTTDWYYDDFRNSAGSSSLSYQQNGGPVETFRSYSDLPRGTPVHKANWKPDKSDFMQKRGKHWCKKGYTLVKVGGAMMCAKFRRNSR